MNGQCLCGVLGLKIYSSATSFTRRRRVVSFLFGQKLTKAVLFILDSFFPFRNLVRLGIGRRASLVDPFLARWNLLLFNSPAVDRAMLFTFLSCHNYLQKALIAFHQVAFLPASNTFVFFAGTRRLLAFGLRRFDIRRCRYCIFACSFSLLLGDFYLKVLLLLYPPSHVRKGVVAVGLSQHPLVLFNLDLPVSESGVFICPLVEHGHLPSAS